MRFQKLNSIKEDYRQQKSTSGRSRLLFENNEWLVVVPLDKDSSCFYGSETEWCSAKQFHSEYEEYFYDADITLVYFLNKKSGIKFAMTIDENNSDNREYFDNDNEKISENKFKNRIGDLELEQIVADAIGKDVTSQKEINRKKYRESIRKIDRLIPLVERGKHNIEIENLLVFTKNRERVKEYLKTVGPSDNYRVELQLVAVNQLGKLVRYFRNPPELVLLDAITQNPRTIKWIKNPSEKLQLTAVSKNGSVLEYIDNPTEKTKIEAVSDDGLAIRYINNPSREVKMAAVQNNGFAIQFIKNPDDKIQLAAVKHNGKAIRYIENPIEKVQAVSVNKNGLAVEYIENPSERIQLIAVSRNGRALQFFEEPSERVKLAAVMNNGNAIQFIDNPSPVIKRAAVKQNPNAFKFIKANKK